MSANNLPLTKLECESLFPASKKTFRPWAQKRNGSKRDMLACLSLIKKAADSETSTPIEEVHLNQAAHFLSWVLEKWETQNPASKMRFGRR